MKKANDQVNNEQNNANRFDVGLTILKKDSRPKVVSPYLYWSGRRDLNPRPSDPQSDALAKLRHAPTEFFDFGVEMGSLYSNDSDRQPFHELFLN